MKVNSLFTILNTIDSFFAHSYSFLIIIFCSFLLKFIFLFFLIKHWYKQTVTIVDLYKITVVLVGASLITDLAWIIKITSTNNLITIPYWLVMSFIRVAWIAFILQYQMTGLLLQRIIKKNINLKKLFVINVPIFFFLLGFLLILFLITMYA